MNADHAADPPTFDYDPGYPQTFERDYDNAYDRVTARDIADLLHQFTEMRCSPRGGVIDTVIDPAERAAFLSRKAELFTRIARRAERTRVDDYSRQVRQMATDARHAAEQARLQIPQQRVGPDQRRTLDGPTARDGAESEENSGASSG
ncbi:hypothetical protein [Pseudonocardia sp. GCM10023141]|uniref:hypothetical protein n=1 Tax=Pseudonocardia sp. GCM10023141 TaxID=3252653 RepID=UPI003616B8FA